MTEDITMGPIAWALADEDVGWLIEAIASASEVVFDFETTGLYPWAVQGGRANGGIGARIVAASFTVPQAGPDGHWNGEQPVTWVLPCSHPESPWGGTWRSVLRRVLEVIRRHEKPLSGHNGKFDLKYAAATVGVNLVSQFSWDTMDGQRMLETGRGLSNKLGDVCEREFGVASWKDFDFRQPGSAETYPLVDLGEYAARDTYWTWRLKRRQQERMFLGRGDGVEPDGSEEVREYQLGKLATWVAMPTVASLAQIEVQGFTLDRELTSRLLEEDTAAAAEALEWMRTRYYRPDPVTGIDRGLEPIDASTAPTSHWFQEFMSRGLKAGDLEIIALTPKGKPQWNKSVLGKLARKHGEGSTADMVLKQRHHTKRAEFLSSWLSVVSPDGQIHANYNTGMVTGRLSSSEPNMQQVNKKLRPCFVPLPGYVVADFDFSQIEMRVAAYIARSQPMLEAFNEGKDLHRMLAAQVTGKAEEDVTPEERQKAKGTNFGLLFGLGAFGLQAYAEDNYGVTMSRDESQEFYHAYFRTWRGLKDWHAAVEARLLRDGFSISPLGRIRYFSGGKHDLNAAINAPVQGMASDLMQLALADIQGLLPAGSGRGRVEGVKPVGTVHDSAVILLPADDWKAKALEVKERMEDLNPLLRRLGVELDVPIVTEATIGTRWSLSDVGTI